MVLESDRTFLTGWGTIQPAHHPKFNHFLGYISFRSNNVENLPWSSTKWGVELDSPVYISALEEMRIQATPILNILDRWKDVKDEDESVTTALHDLLQEGKPTSVFASANQERVFEYKPKKILPEMTRITFIKNKDLVQKVKESLGDVKMKNSSLGEFIFDYYVESELDQ